MISKHIACLPQNDNYIRLAKYIAAGRESEHDILRWDGTHSGSEKCLISWCAGCWAGDDYDLAMQEVIDTQALNSRTTKEKTYHLVVSFRPEDGPKLTPDILKEIERRFAEVLKLSEHQRHAGVHVNTENMHMHVAYNLIHPEKLVRIEPWRDYIARDKLCRALEKEFGLAIDPGREKNKERGLGSQAATMEAHKGQQSFEGYAHEQGAAIFEKLEDAQSWEDVHRAFARHGMELHPRGAGLVVKDRHGKQRAKASTVHREFSLKKLEDRFGSFHKFMGELPDSEIQYKVKPLQKEADRNHLWTEFQAAREANKQELAAIKQKWRDYRDDLKKQALGKRTRSHLLQLSRQHEARERHRLEMQCPGNWMAFLQQKAHAGDENALAVLRSREEEVRPDTKYQREQMKARAELLDQKIAILENERLNVKTKKRLASHALMESLVPEVKTAVTKHGHLVYTLPDGEKICDSGKRITFSEGARAAALTYMAAQWNVQRVAKDRDGQSVFILADGQKVRDRGQREFERPAPQTQRARQKEKDWER